MIAAKVEPLTEEEVAHRKEVATEMLLKWRAEKPINARRADLKEMAIHRYEDELRMIATIAAIRAENAELRGRALDHEMIAAIAGTLYEQPFVYIPREWRNGPIDPEVKVTREMMRIMYLLIDRRIAKRKDAGKEPTNV